MALRGYLRLVVLKALEESPKSGYALIKSVHEFTGQKPSAGSMYPLLEQLRKKDLVTVKEKGRLKEYALTAEGKKAVKEVHDLHNNCFDDFLNRMKMLSALTGDDLQMVMSVVEKMREGDDPFKPLNPELHRFRIELIRLFHETEFKNNALKIKKILGKSIKELKAL